MSSLAYLDCIGGVAGDMLLAALLDAGAPAERLTELPSALGLEDVRVEVTRVSRHGVPALHVDVVEPAGRRPSVPELREAIQGSSIPARPRERAASALARLAAAEARVHGVTSEDVRLHELGSADTLIDLCGAFVLLESLGIERVVCSPVPYARGLVQVAHGTLPSPTPVVLDLLEGAAFAGVETSAELVTPTGAAIVAEACTAWGPLPPMTLRRVGYGAGTRDLLDRPNILRVVIGDSEGAMPGRANVVLLEAGVDDLLPELVPDAVSRCFEAGAVDVWATPIQMKKGRPGVVVSALSRPETEVAVARALLEHTSTLGVRVVDLRRYELERERREVDVEGHAVGVKLGVLDGRVLNVAPEHDDCARVARDLGRPVKQVWAAALAAGQELYGRAR